MINAFISPEPLQFLASNFEKSTEYCSHPTIVSIQILSVDVMCGSLSKVQIPSSNTKVWIVFQLRRYLAFGTSRSAFITLT